MASVDSSSPGCRRFLRLRKPVPIGQNSHISSSSYRPAETANGSKKKSFAPTAFRGLGCASSTASQAHAPASSAAVCSSADWQGKRARRRRVKPRKKERTPAAAADLWCSPIIALAAGDDSVDCVVSHRDHVGRGWRRYPERPLREAMLFDTRILFGRGSFDNYRDWRLDVDNMTYEELLELGDKIGHVSTGLREEEIASCIRKVNNTYFDMHFSSEMERKCSICQEEFVMNDEVGKLGCGHSYHPYCIKKWLLKKNACPVCKITVSKA